jgi:transcriptional regulator with XRE-family HTH domain
MSVGENIKRLREGKKWTQQELADKVGVSRPMIAQIERDTKSVSLKFGAELAAVFECTVEELLK